MDFAEISWKDIYLHRKDCGGGGGGSEKMSTKKMLYLQCQEVNHPVVDPNHLQEDQWLEDDLHHLGLNLRHHQDPLREGLQ